MLKNLGLKLFFAALSMFKGSIRKIEEKTPALVKILEWVKTIDAELQAFSEGKPLPQIDTGNKYLNGIETVLADFIEAEVKAPADLKVVLDEISTNTLAILTEIDPAAAEAYKTPAPDEKADAKTKGNAAVTKAVNSLNSLTTIAGGIKTQDGNVASTITYHVGAIGEAIDAIKELIHKW